MPSNDRLVDERSPLLTSRSNSSAAPDVLPSISNIEARLYLSPPAFLEPQLILDTVQTLALPSEDHIKALTLLIGARRVSGSFVDHQKGFQPWSVSRAEGVEELVKSLWKEVAEQDDVRTLDTILWIPFRLSEDHEETQTGMTSDSLFVLASSITRLRVEVMKALLTYKTSLDISLDDRLIASLLRVWKGGRPTAESRLSIFERLRYMSSPRCVSLCSEYIPRY